VLTHRTNEPRPPGAVSASELEHNVLRFIAERYADRHLDVETTQLGLSMLTWDLDLTSDRTQAACRQPRPPPAIEYAPPALYRPTPTPALCTGPDAKKYEKFLQAGKAKPPGGNKAIGLRKNPIVARPL